MKDDIWISKFRKLTDDQIKSTLKILNNTCYNKVAKIKEKMRSLQVAWGKNKQANKTKSWNLLLQFSSVQSLSRVRLFATPWTTARQASLSVTNSRSSPKSTSIELVMPSNRLILCHPLLLLPSIFPSISVFSNLSALHIRLPKHWSFSFNISPYNENPRLISLRMDWLDLLAVQGTLKSLLQHNSSKASIVQRSVSLQYNSHIHT